MKTVTDEVLQLIPPNATEVVFFEVKGLLEI